MEDNIEYGDWVYFKNDDNIEKTYFRVLRKYSTDQGEKIEMVSLDGRREYEPKSKLCIVTDVLLIHQLDTSFNMQD